MWCMYMRRNVCRAGASEVLVRLCGHERHSCARTHPPSLPLSLPPSVSPSTHTQCAFKHARAHAHTFTHACVHSGSEDGGRTTVAGVAGIAGPAERAQLLSAACSRRYWETGKERARKREKRGGERYPSLRLCVYTHTHTHTHTSTHIHTHPHHVHYLTFGVLPPHNRRDAPLPPSRRCCGLPPPDHQPGGGGCTQQSPRGCRSSQSLHSRSL